MSTFKKVNRRSFLKKAGSLGAGAFAIPQIVPSFVLGKDAPSNKLNFACIGVGGRMHNSEFRDLKRMNENVVAICDVDAERIKLTQSMPELGVAKARVYKDYRELLANEKSLDAVVISTADHWHADICTAAIKAGKHVFCEKPLVHTIGESRRLAKLAKHSKVATQTGNQGAASDNFRKSMEIIQAGVLGDVGEVHIWHPTRGPGRDRPAGSEPTPKGFDWDFWLGKAPWRPYRGGYHPGAWRAWFDFGGGSLVECPPKVDPV